MIINNISRFFYPDDKNKIYFCRNCCNKMYSQKKFDEHLQFCQTNKTQLLLPSQNKYLQFKNLQNTIQHNFIAYADIESYMIHNEKNIYEHNHLMSGYYLHCINEKYSKKVKLFDKLEDFRDNLIDELDYIKNINENKLNFDIDMKNFDKEEFDKVEKCKHCDHKFNEDFNNRKITLIEKVDKYKLQRIIDDFDNNNINEETQNNLKKYYENLDDNGEIKIIYKQNYNSGRYYSDQFSLQNMFNEVRSSIIHIIIIPEKDYSIKIIDSLAFLQSNLDSLSKDLDDDLKIITKKHFQDKFEMVNKKLENFPYNYVNPKNLENANLPDKKYFYNMLKLKDITDEEYKKVKNFYKNMEFKNLREYLECCLKSDITLLADIFNNFRKIISYNLGLDPVKYISAPSLTKDCALKYSKCKIENIKYVSIFQFVRKSIMGGLSDSINPYVKLDNENETIAYNDISSQYPYELSKKLPYKNYKFVEEFDENKYGQDKDYGCIMLCDVRQLK